MWLETGFVCFCFRTLWGQLKNSQALLTSANPFLHSVGITSLEMLQLGTAVREIWIRPIHLFTGAGVAGRILNVFMLQLCCCITSDQGAFLSCYFLRHHFIFCRFHFVKGGTLWLPSSKCLNKYWTYSYGRFPKIAVLGTFPRQAGCWEGNYGAAGAEAGCCRECGR